MTKTKKTLLSILVAVLLVSILSPFSVFAADYEGYLSMIDMNQYGYSFPSSYPAPFGGVSRSRAVQLYVGGQVAYCVEFGVLTESGIGYNSSDDWGGLSAGDKNLVGYTLMFGYNGATRYGGTVDQEYWATQVLIWQIIAGTVNTSWEDGVNTVFMGSGSVAATIYHQIKANVYSYNTIPSFTARVQSASPTHELDYNPATGLFETTLTDTNNVLSSFSFSAAGYTMTQSGNTLKVTAAQPPNETMVSSPKALPSFSAGVIRYWHPGSGRHQTVCTYQLGGFNDPVNAHFKLKVSTGNIVIEKSTEDGANLAGIEFTVKGNNGVVRTATTDAAGKAQLVGLPVGVYTVTENPDSHHPQYVTASSQNITVLAGQTHTLRFHNRIKKGQIALTKFEPDENNALHKNPMAGVTFTVTHKDTGTVACTLTTDANGYAITPLLNYGVYVVTETYVEGYTLLEPFEVFIDTDGKIYGHLLENHVYESMLKIVKVDAETGKTIPLAGTKFRIEDSEGKPVTQMLYYPTPTEISEFVTAADGSLTLPQPLEYGTYKLYEVLAPEGYVLNGDPLEFTVTALNFTETLEVTFANEAAKGTVSIQKIGEMLTGFIQTDSDYGTLHTPIYEQRPLAGVTFQIIANEDIYTPDGTLRSAKDTVVDTITTAGADGSVTSKKLFLGQYRIEEVSTAEGFVLDSQPRYVSLEYVDQHTEIVIETVTLENQRQQVAVSFLKDMELGTQRTDKPFANVVFGVFTRDEITTADADVLPAGSLLELVIPNTNGTAQLVSDLPLGAYFLKELATAPGYIVDEAEYDFVFSCGGGEIEVVIVTLNNDEPLLNKIMRGNAKLIKTDTGGGRLLGATFTLYTAWGDLVGEYTTNSNGEILVEGLSYGSYYWLEKSAPTGFVYDGTPHPFNITAEGEVVEVTAVNHRPDIPQTGDDSNLALWIVLCALSFASLTVGLWYMVKRYKER